MGFGTIRDQDAAVGFLRQALAQGRIPSAYLFRGPHHVGKRTTALALAQALNCEVPAAEESAGDACGACAPCRQIAAEVHPDVETVRPDGQYIRIDQVRGVADRLGLIPFSARKRVIVVAQADRMNPQAANAFLKTLEEPPADTLLVLCVQDPGHLPETIVSRCVPVRFGLLGEATVRDLLGREGDLAPEALDFAVRFAQGRVRPALRERAARWMGVRDDLLRTLTARHGAAFPQVSERCAQWSSGEDWRFVLEWLETWFRDLALLAAGAPPERLINGDRPEALQAAAAGLSAAQADRAYREVLATREAIVGWNANKTLALEGLWLGLRDIA